MEATTPSALTEPVLTLCEKLVPGATPLYVNVTPALDAVVSDCYPNVQREIARSGGEIVYGWQIWQSDLMVEGEFHALWRTPHGDLVDLTPKADGETKILFLADPVRTWTGAYVDNVRQPLIPSELFDDLNLVYARMTALWDRCPAAPNGLKMVPAHLQAPLERSKMILILLIRAGGTKHTRCLCGSGEKFKNCCRRVYAP